MNDEAFLKGLKKQDNEVIKHFMDKVNPMVMKLVLSNSGSEDDSAELLIDATMALLRNLQKEGFQLTSKLSTYFYSIAQNIWFKKLRKRGRDISMEDMSLIVEENISIPLVEEDPDPRKINKVLSALDKIDEKCKKVILMAHYQGYRHVEIAEEMDYTEQFVRQKLRRCLTKVRKFLGLK